MSRARLEPGQDPLIVARPTTEQGQAAVALASQAGAALTNPTDP
jgi:hypothetical protein